MVGRPADASIFFLAGAFTLVVTGLFCVPCRYTLLEDAVSIRCGLLCYQIAYSEIRSVEKSYDLRSAPALSIRRVKIHTQQRDYLVSPKDRDEFLAMIHLKLAEDQANKPSV